MKTPHYNHSLNKVVLFFLITVLLFSMTACWSSQNDRKKMVNPQKVEKTLEGVNRYLVQKDNDAIRAYIKRHGWNMKQTGTGLWYEIYEHGTGDSIKSGNLVTVNYKVYLMDGTLCYSSDSTGSKTFKVGHGGVESGLEQGILLLCTHDKARFIMQPYMAHGLLGDLKKIPPRSTIIYDIEVLQVSNK
jgi:FKBP-type peptidyl-prolyl cis-trans isomerase